MGLLRSPAMRVPTPARKPISDEQPSFKDGLNTVSTDYAVLETQMRRSDNIRLNDYGAATKRGGTQRTAGALVAATTVRNGYGWRKDSSTFYTLAMCNGHLFTTTYGAFPLTWTDQSGAFTASAVPSFAGFRDTSANVVYVASGGALRKWDGTTLTSLANPVHASGVCVYHDRLWGWGVSGTLDSIYYSNLSAATSSKGGDSLGYAPDSGGQIVVRTFGQQDIVSAAVVNTSLLIWHKRGISRITGYGNSDITVTPEAITADVGLVGQGALVVFDNIAYFVSERGVYQANEMSVSPLDTPDKPDPVRAIISTLTAANLALIKCAYNRPAHELWVQVPGVGIYLYHTVLQSWSGPFVDGYTNPDTTCLFETLNASGQPVMLRGDETGFVSLCDEMTYFLDNVAAAGTGGTAYNGVIQCHRMFCGDATRANAYRWIYLLGQPAGSTQINVAWNTITDAESYQIPVTQLGAGGAWGATTSTWGTGIWGAGGQTPFYIPASGVGPFIDVIITDSGMAASQYMAVQVQGVAYGQR